MNRVVDDIGIRIDVRRISYQEIISINLSEVSIPDWSLNLCLLKEGLVSELLFLGHIKLRIAVDRQCTEARATVSVTTEMVRLSVQSEELEYWTAFFLKYYRDGWAEVNHIDVEAVSDSEPAENIYITFEVADHQPPEFAES